MVSKVGQEVVAKTGVSYANTGGAAMLTVETHGLVAPGLQLDTSYRRNGKPYQLHRNCRV